MRSTTANRNPTAVEPRGANLQDEAERDQDVHRRAGGHHPERERGLQRAEPERLEAPHGDGRRRARLERERQYACRQQSRETRWYRCTDNSRGEHGDADNIEGGKRELALR